MSPVSTGELTPETHRESTIEIRPVALRSNYYSVREYADQRSAPNAARSVSPLPLRTTIWFVPKSTSWTRRRRHWRSDLPLDGQGAQEARDLGRSGPLPLREVSKRARMISRRWDMRRSGSIEGRRWPCPGGSPLVRFDHSEASRVEQGKSPKRRESRWLDGIGYRDDTAR
jgi:hypothetical protein